MDDQTACPPGADVVAADSPKGVYVSPGIDEGHLPAVMAQLETTPLLSGPLGHVDASASCGVRSGTSHTCDQCSFASSSAGGLRKHVDRAHIKKRKMIMVVLACYECPPGYRNSFVSPRTLAAHNKRFHAPGFVCTNCPHRVRTLKALSVHVKKHHADLSLPCGDTPLPVGRPRVS